MGRNREGSAMDKDLLSVGWKMLILRGVIAVVIGILVIAWPIESAIAFVLLWGFWALFDGVGDLIQAFQPESKGNRLWLVVMGVISLIVAFFAIFSPAMAATALTWILGIWLIVRGVFELIAAFSSTLAMPRWLLLLSAGVSIVIGILFVANPGAGAVGIAVLLGIMALIWGVVFLVLGFLVRRELEHTPPTGTAEPSPA
jgi:uncharacterized membrane protein HdeD (DUF308 family)